MSFGKTVLAVICGEIILATGASILKRIHEQIEDSGHISLRTLFSKGETTDSEDKIVSRKIGFGEN